MAPSIKPEQQPSLEYAPTILDKMRTYKTAIYAVAVLSIATAFSPDSANSQEPVTTQPAIEQTNVQSSAAVESQTPNVQQPIWARSPTGKVLATRWACKPPRRYPSFQCPPATQEQKGAMLFEYNSNGGRTSEAMLYVPQRTISEYENTGRTKPRPLAIYLHGRGLQNVDDSQYRGYWSSGLFPTPDGVSSYEERMHWAANHFGVIIAAPEGQGRTIKGRSWGYEGQIKDVSRMPNLVRQLLPYINIDKKRVYVFGSSMGGHESMQAMNQYPNVFAAGYSDDGVSNWVKRYSEFKYGVKKSGKISDRSISFEASQRDVLVKTAIEETGGTPSSNIWAYLRRSPLFWLKQRGPAVCHRPMFVGINTNDSIVPNSQSESYVNSFRRKCGKFGRNIVVSYSNGGHSAQTQRSTGYTTPLNFFRNGGDWITLGKKYRR